MKSYNVTPANDQTKTQSHVKELNANVATGTFPSDKGEFFADLYKSKNSCSVLVYAASCPPVNDTFVTTVKLIF